MVRTLGGLVCLVLAGTLGTACEHKPPIRKSERSKVKVALPATPDLSPKTYNRRFDDGALTVYELTAHGDEHLGKEVTVRGKVAELALCEIVLIPQPAPPAPAPDPDAAPGEQAPPPPPPPPKKTFKCERRPFGWLVDPQHPKQRFKILVAGSMLSPLAELKDGQLATVKGQFVTATSDRAYFSRSGLVALPTKPPADGDADGS